MSILNVLLRPDQLFVAVDTLAEDARRRHCLKWIVAINCRLYVVPPWVKRSF